jgi:hypothetical protein
VLALFWMKIAVRRIIVLVKIAPFVFIGSAVFITAFVYTKTNVAVSLHQIFCYDNGDLVFYRFDIFTQKHRHTGQTYSLFKKRFFKPYSSVDIFYTTGNHQ